MRKIVLPLVIAGLLAAGGAAAQQPGGGQPPPQPSSDQRFMEFDLNKDNRITKQEFMAAAEKRWTRMVEHIDTNKDGVLSREEFVAAPQPPSQGGGQPPQGGSQPLR